MLFKEKDVKARRALLRKALGSGKLLRFPGSFSPLVSMLIEKMSFDGIYISGAVLSNDLGWPDIGLTTLSEVSSRGGAIARVTSLPSIIDIDTGFGETMNVARTILEMETSGLSGCHMEDQQNPKRCGHLDNKVLVDVDDMVKKIRSAVLARQDPNFLLIARTDARGVLGLEEAIKRANAYVDAGADMIFPEALKDIKEFETFRKHVKAPLLANMTEFGKSPLLSYDELNDLGYSIVIYPVTLLRTAMKSVEDALNVIKEAGTQESILDNMQNRAQLYELLSYKEYNTFDNSLYDFTLNQK